MKEKDARKIATTKSYIHHLWFMSCTFLKFPKFTWALWILWIKNVLLATTTRTIYWKLL